MQQHSEHRNIMKWQDEFWYILVSITWKQRFIWQFDCHPYINFHSCVDTRQRGVRFKILKSCLLCSQLKTDSLTQILHFSCLDCLYFTWLLKMMWWITFKNKINVDAVAGNAATSQPRVHCKCLPLMQVIWIWKKKESAPIQSKQCFSWKQLCLSKFLPVYLQMARVGFNLQAYFGKNSLVVGTLFLNQTSERLPCATLCSLNFDTDSNWLHHEKPKVIILMD